MAQAFDPDTAVFSEAPIALADPVGSYRTRGFFAVANGGAIVYRTGETMGARPELVDRSGKGEVVKTQPGSVLDVAVSPDGRGILATVSKPGIDSVWVLDPARGAHTRITFDDAPARGPIWSPNGKSIVYWAKGLWRKPANGSGTAEKIAPPGLVVWCWSHDAKNLVVSKGITRESETGLFLLPIDGDRKPVPLLPSKFVLTQAQFSPDDHWIAYVSDESGESEIYVQHLPATGERIRISNSGGVQPRWSRDGRELFYVEPRGKLMAVALRYGKALEADAPTPLFDARLSSLSPTASHRYDVTPDGKHFYLSRVPETQNASPLRVILNWQGTTR
jgi:dipeptidyl aminopeptidase/acylaminoacyl peptidase